ncbi:nuclear transport factor 2 family protein [Herbiconiux daphne]|uniref:Nuclear transport factor 2 family protein n=1 Tax=Herbiconiux daphne TaxID=2970914 RepID=A0ABT2H3L7_9MICO|nr:nuclear transport factor 2 family protein [Herbiconiux daphne]MCS5734528.1 nuclear transport factor 2 family protein [Herbiconiux daphne]
MTTAQELADREIIRELLARNTAWMDGHGGVATDLYSPDVILRSARGNVYGLEEALKRIGPKPDDRHQHFFTDPLLDVDGDTANVELNLLVHGYRLGEAPHTSRGARAGYTFARTDAGWRITEARVSQLWEITTS